ncbi:MAG: Asp-tRNA(Asn)/Glu-tRNA(Gln) amidotransferase subunit GatA [bacterium]|nr:Asp-tRNA(Asn)/Glu-tRNA(Gln) amidotransferase subunit GatA [bacterium]
MKIKDIRHLTQSFANWQKAVKSNQFDLSEFSRSLVDYMHQAQTKTQSYITILPPAEINKKLQAAVKSNKPLLGWPFSMKDIFITKGIKTTASSKILQDFVPNYDSTIHQRLSRLGGTLTAKTNSDAWGFGASTENSDFYSSKNPYDTNKVPGGSSGGSAASVAMGLSAFDIAEDTGGSIRQPAAFCGLIGFKPTYGSISRYGAIAFSSSLDTVGLIGRDIKDIVWLFNQVKGPDQKDATVYPDQKPTKIYPASRLKAKKIGYIPGFLDENVQPDIISHFHKVKDFYTNNFNIEFVEINMPHFDYGLAVYYILAPAEASSNLARYDGLRYGRSRDQFGHEAIRRILLGNFALASGYYDAYYLKALKVRRLIYQDFIQAFKKVDALLLPATPTTAFDLGEKSQDPLQMYLNDIFTIPPSLAGVPGISFPTGFDSQGLPVSLQLVGPHFSEGLLAGLILAWQQSIKPYLNYPNLP